MDRLCALSYTGSLPKCDCEVRIKKMKVIWTLASAKASDRPTSFGRLRGILIGDRYVRV